MFLYPRAPSILDGVHQVCVQHAHVSEFSYQPQTILGTEFDGISFRREIPATFQSIAATAQQLLPSLPAPSPFVRPAAYLLPLSRLVKMVNVAAWDDVEKYSELVERCRYGGPPSVEMYREAKACVERIDGV
jgi:hypothetical protein